MDTIEKRIQAYLSKIEKNDTQKLNKRKIELTLDRFKAETQEVAKEIQKLENDSKALKREVANLLNRYYGAERKIEVNMKQYREYKSLLDQLGMTKSATLEDFIKTKSKFDGLNTATKMKGFINNF